jgi:hypothetical protein
VRQDGAFVAVQRVYLIELKADKSSWHEFCSLYWRRAANTANQLIREQPQ